MQRSRRAFLQRRAIEKAIGRNHLYKLSLSLAILLWGLVFLLNLWISHGHSFRAESGALDFNVSSWEEDKLETSAGSGSADKHSVSSVEDHRNMIETCKEHSYEAPCTDGAKTEEISGDLHSSKDSDRSISGSGVRAEMETADSDMKLSRDNGKANRLTRVVPLGLDEFKHKALNSRSTNVPGSKGSIIHRVEPGGADYNYASSAKGAKVLDSNKEAKGASNILSKDKDKYLRNPCSAEDKFVVIELSEETLVDTVKIANFEHYSSNLKYFELLGSLVYPTDTWVKLGNFSAANVKHAQPFVLHEPKWVRYLKLNILGHYGSEFYCTLSAIEVYGVDAVERMLEDLIAEPDNHYIVAEPPSERESESPVPESVSKFEQNVSVEGEPSESSNLKHESTSDTVSDPAEEVRHPQVSRMPGDTVLKILMQKVRALDLSLSVLERYLEELNSRYGNIFKDMDKEMDEKDQLVEKIRSDIKDLLDSKDAMARNVDELMVWRSLVSKQLDALLKDNIVLRSEVRQVQENQLYMEKKGIVVFLISTTFGFIALGILFIDTIRSLYRSEKSRKFCWMKASWILLLLSCSTTMIIISL